MRTGRRLLPSHRRTRRAASTALCGATSSEPEQLRWLDARYAAALGKSHLTGTLGAWSAGALMGNLGPAATNYEVVRAAVGADAKPPPAGGWPVAVFSHSLTGWRHVNSSLCAELASHGAVVMRIWASTPTARPASAPLPRTAAF